MRKAFQRRRHGLGAAVAPGLAGLQHAHQSQILSACGPHVLLQPRLGAWNHQGAFVEGQDLAEGVVAAHADDADGPLHQALHLRVEGQRLHLVQAVDACHEVSLLFAAHEGAQHDQRGMWDRSVAFVGRQDPVHDGFAIAAAADGDQNVGFGDLFQIDGLRCRGSRPAQIAGVADALGDGGRQVETGQWLTDLRQPVDPDIVVVLAQRRQNVLALPFVRQHLGIVHHVPQAQHAGHPALVHQAECRRDLAAQAQWLLVHDEEVGIENVGRVFDDRGAQGQRVFDGQRQGQGGVFAVAQLDHAGNAYEIDPAAEVEAADNRGSGEDQHTGLAVGFHEGMRDLPAAPQVAQAEGIVTVD